MACLVASCFAFLPKSHLLRRGSFLCSAVDRPPPTSSPIFSYDAYILVRDSEQRLRDEQEKASNVVIKKLDELMMDLKTDFKELKKETEKGMLELKTDLKELKKDTEKGMLELNTKVLWLNIVGVLLIAILSVTVPNLRDFLTSMIGNVFKL